MNRAAARQMLVDLTRLALACEAGSQCHAAPLAADEWAHLLDLATRHEVAPLVRRGLCTAGIDAPPQVAASLVQAARACEVRVMLALEQLEEALLVFEAARIEVILLKGALFAAHFYPSPGLRPFGDLDLLVRQKDLATAVQALEGAGYEAYQGRDGRGQAWWTEHHNHWVFENPNAMPIELHWALSPPRSEIQFDAHSIWRDSVRLADNPCIRRMSDTDQLLYLAVHAVKHQLALPLRNFVDAAVVLQKSEFVVWQELIERAESIGAAQDVAAYLLTTQELGMIRLPAVVSRKLANALCGRLSPTSLARYAIEWPLLDMPHALIQASGRGSLVKTLQAIRTGLAAPAPKTTSTGTGVVEQQSRLVRRLKKAWRLPRSAREVRTAAAIHKLFSEREAP